MLRGQGSAEPAARGCFWWQPEVHWRLLLPDKSLKAEGLTQGCRCAQIAPMEVGRINIQYRRVECTPPEPLLVSINHNYGPGAWLRIVVSVRAPLSCTPTCMPPHHSFCCAFGSTQ